MPYSLDVFGNDHNLEGIGLSLLGKFKSTTSFRSSLNK